MRTKTYNEEIIQEKYKHFSMNWLRDSVVVMVVAILLFILDGSWYIEAFPAQKLRHDLYMIENLNYILPYHNLLRQQ